MKAPEKIYLQDSMSTDTIGDLWPEWFDAEVSDNSIEYIRTDVFIEKTCTFLKDRIEHDSIDYPMARMSLIEDFKNYMKHEYERLGRAGVPNSLQERKSKV